MVLGLVLTAVDSWTSGTGLGKINLNILINFAFVRLLLPEVERRVMQTAVERMHVESAFEERDLESTDSQANFSWVSLGDRDEDEVMRGLADRGVIVRAGKALGQEGWMRVTYGSRRENDRFLAALDETL